MGPVVGKINGLMGWFGLREADNIVTLSTIKFFNLCKKENGAS